MKFCTQCGHKLGAGRTCPGCGTLIAVEPPPASQLPPGGSRYPLFVDELVGATFTTSGKVLPRPVSEPLPPREVTPTSSRLHPTARVDRVDAGGPVDPGHPGGPGERVRAAEPTRVAVLPARSRAGAPVRALGVLLVLAMVGVAVFLLVRGLGGAPGRGSDGASTSAGPGAEVAGTATAHAPVTDQPGVDTAGNTTSYDASNMLDGDATTTWRMPGDGSGTVLTFTLAKETELARVGLVNGYAKTSHQGGATLDWYAGNRRVRAVEWLFDDGSTVEQRLDDTRAMQRIAVHTTTRTVRLRLLEVSGPGSGPAARDTTPVSEVSLRGVAG